MTAGVDTPTISNSTYSSNTLMWAGDEATSARATQVADALRRIEAAAPAVARPPLKAQVMPKEQENWKMRIVKVFIADPNENLALVDRLLYRGAESLTDATDQELFFEVPMQEILTQHNAKRVKTVDRKASDRAGKDIFLEPVRIRDLKMVIVDVAKF